MILQSQRGWRTSSSSACLLERNKIAIYMIYKYQFDILIYHSYGRVVVLPLIVEWRSWMTSFVHVVTFFLGFVHCPWTSEQHSKQPQKHQQQDGLKHLKLTLRYAAMWVIRIEDVLAMAGTPPHHEELQKQGLLVSWFAGQNLSTMV